jgi:uncharacterized membrane-anchored protein YhcB (DUF1043 family)
VVSTTWWTTGFLVGAVIGAIAAALLIATIALARRIVSQAETIVERLDFAREKTAPLYDRAHELVAAALGEVAKPRAPAG